MGILEYFEGEVQMHWKGLSIEGKRGAVWIRYPEPWRSASNEESFFHQIGLKIFGGTPTVSQLPKKLHY